MKAYILTWSLVLGAIGSLVWLLGPWRKSSPFESSIDSDAAWTQSFVVQSQKVAKESQRLQLMAKEHAESCTQEGNAKGQQLMVDFVGNIYRCVDATEACASASQVSHQLLKPKLMGTVYQCVAPPLPVIPQAPPKVPPAVGAK